MAKPVRLRRRAADDVDEVLRHLVDEAGEDVAARFVGALERSLHHIGRLPHSGSLRFAYELDLPDLRAWPIARFPYVVFYVARQLEIDVWRVLHTRRDVPASLAGEIET